MADVLKRDVIYEKDKFDLRNWMKFFEHKRPILVSMTIEYVKHSVVDPDTEQLVETGQIEISAEAEIVIPIMAGSKLSKQTIFSPGTIDIGKDESRLQKLAESEKRILIEILQKLNVAGLEVLDI